ncbi:spore germination protein KC [Paenibacillus phyllosphaerae]|uniref:Spore germination protein KC n=1 Tax=Paenibacillus phyllosphaerae TaxID=274593 RepID=A0A7W5B350_9BACL|nr:Ger(x)C family spore germination protein [Paenibacillus phyllosphaerae]MBB3113568.1 spore germination protein KC [Paenibacillus phyllosphaerae]
MINRTMLLAVSLLMLIMSSGCLGKQEINDLAIVTAVGIDNGENNHVKLSVQIVRPADARGQTGAPSGGTGEPIYSIQATGRTIFEAARNLARFSSRRVYWAHNFVIVLGEGYARKGIADMIDFFTRNHELRMTTWVVVTPEEAGQVIATITGMEVVPGEAIDKLFRYNQIVAEAPGTNMMRLQESFLAEGTEPVLAKVQLRPRGISNKNPDQFGSLDQVVLSGAAVFEGDKMKGWLSPSEAKGLLPFIEEVDSEIMVINCPDDSNNHATLEIKSLEQRVKTRFVNNQVKVQVAQTANANLVEMGCEQPFTEIKDQMTLALKQKLENQVLKTASAAQKKYKSDIMKIGQVFHNTYPLEWKQIHSEWNRYFEKAEITVSADAKISSPVLKIQRFVKGDGLSLKSK